MPKTTRTHLLHDQMADHLWAIYPPALARLGSIRDGRDMPGDVQRRELMAAREPQSVYPVANGVAVINVSGVMQKYADYWVAVYGGAVHTELEQAVKAAAADPNVRAILLRIDSPGGSVAGASDFADAVFAARYVKPVVAYVSDLGASAGYYVASQASKVYSDSDALIGSIGTIAVIYDWSRFFEEAGVKANVFTSQQDPNKGAGVMGAPLTETQSAYMQEVVDDLGAKFVQDIYRGRPAMKDSALSLPDGRVFLASKALDYGLIDGIRSFDSVLAELQGDGWQGGQVAGGRRSAGASAHADLDLLSRRLDLEG